MLRFTLAAAATLAMTAPAFAGTFVAETVTPVPQGESIVAYSAVWACTETACAAQLDRKKVSVRVCKSLVKEIGPVKSFSNETSALTEAQLESCNAAAK